MDLVAIIVTLAAVAGMGWVFYKLSGDWRGNADADSGKNGKTPFQAPAE